VDETVVAGVTESRGQKNDTRDAYGLAEKLRTGALGKRIFKAPREFSVLRELSRMPPDRGSRRRAGAVAAEEPLPLAGYPGRGRLGLRRLQPRGLAEGASGQYAPDWVRTADGRWIRAQVPQTRGLTRQHNRVLKEIFKGAATTVITQRRGAIYGDYERLLEAGTKPSLAKLTLALSIAAIVLCMWKRQEVYQPEHYRRSIEADREA
jgi:hypothetical protein